MTDPAHLDSEALKRLAHEFLHDGLPLDRYWQALAEIASAQLEQATVDLDRRRRCGYPEVIFGEGKSVPTMSEIARRLMASGQPVLATRVAPEMATALAVEFPQAQYNPVGRTWHLPLQPQPLQPQELQSRPCDSAAEQPDGVEQTGRRSGWVAVDTAGTSDLPVAEEAADTLAWMGVDVLRVTDVGVAGPHRLTARVAQLRRCHAIVVVAGMEGALPSVVGGHVACPVIAVPTSVGYGANFGGVAALLAMLNSCAANVAVVNIDAGFKAGYVAGMIAQRSLTSEAMPPWARETRP